MSRETVMHSPPTHLPTEAKLHGSRLPWAPAREVFGADLRSLALLRMGLGVLIVADLIDRARDLRAHYTDFGLLARGPLLTRFMNEVCVCLHAATGTAVGNSVLFLLQGLVAVNLAIGLHTRVMAVASWFLMYSLHLRNPVVLQGGDDLLRMLLFWGMFLPLGACYSVDSALSQGDTLGRTPTRSTYAFFSMGSVALLGQMLLLYWSTALVKTGEAWHIDFAGVYDALINPEIWHEAGSAVYYALNFDELALRPAQWLRQYHGVTVLLTKVTISWETFGPFLLMMPILFGPMRTFACAAFALMHHCFALCLMLGLFPWIDTVSMLMLLPAWFWSRLSHRVDWQAQRRITIYFDGPCDVCKKLVLILREFLLLPEVAIQASQSEPRVLARMEADHSWVVDDGAVLHSRFDAFRVLVAASPLWPKWAVAVLPRRLGELTYVAIAAARSRLSAITTWLLPYKKATVWPPRPIGDGLCLLLFGLVAWWNLSTWPADWGPQWGGYQLPGQRVLPPAEEVKPLFYLMRIDQDWGMFAPFPQKEDGWYVLPGNLVDGRQVDVYRHTYGAPSFDKPELITAMYKNQRWSKYMMNIWLARNADYRLTFGQYLCRTWNGAAGQKTPDSLDNFEIFYVKEMTLLNNQNSAPERVSIWKHYCFEVPK